MQFFFSVNSILSDRGGGLRHFAQAVKSKWVPKIKVSNMRRKTQFSNASALALHSISYKTMCMLLHLLSASQTL